MATLVRKKQRRPLRGEISAYSGVKWAGPEDTNRGMDMTPDAIPQDIWELADKAHYAMLQADTHDEQIDIIAFAVLAERLRCGALANKYRHETSSLMSMPPQSAAAAAIERAILSGEPI
ncbi:hypothetical protein [Brucella anthropi]|uniref:hypothetical protein n=1 Tax=Brucella anthropi TaxID=529 RepID=UPI00124DFEF7|nr:hypothetical protein [Brucella anthropi]